jgi:PKD repeat protein
MTTYYVDGASGNDTTGTGSSGSPWKTLTKAAGAIGNGDKVYVRPATYHETLTIPASLTDTEWISTEQWGAIIDGYWSRSVFKKFASVSPLNGGPAGYDFLPRISSTSAYAALVSIQGEGTIFDGFFVRNSTMRGIQAEATDSEVRNCRVDFCRGMCVSLLGGNPLLEDCVITYGVIRQVDGWGKANGGIVNLQNTDGAIVRGNVIAYSARDGLIVNDSNVNAVIENNVVHSNGAGGQIMDEGSGEGDPAKATIIRNNFIYAVPEAMGLNGTSAPGIIVTFEIAGGKTPVVCTPKIYNNIVVNTKVLFALRNNDITDCQLYRSYIAHNTFVAGPNTLTEFNFSENVQSTTKIHNAIFENNVIDSTVNNNQIGARTISGIVFRNNIWRGTPPVPVRGTNSQIATDPELVNSANIILPTSGTGVNMSYTTTANAMDYKLLVGSPAIDAASSGSTAVSITPTDVTEDYFTADRPVTKTSRDIGAHEYGGTISANAVTASFTQSHTAGREDLTVQFTDASSATGSAVINSYLWDFGDGEISTETNPEHTYTEPGNYAPTLTVADTVLGLSSTYTGSTISVTEATTTGADVVVGVTRVALPTSDGEMTLTAALYDNQPVAAEFYTVGAISDGTAAAHNVIGVGLTDGTTEFACANYAKDNVGTTVAKRRWTNGACLMLCDEDGAVLVTGTFNRWEDNAVVLDIAWTGTPAAYLVTAVLHAGANTQAAVVVAEMGGLGDETTITAGFAPQIVKVATSFKALNMAADDAYLSLGVAGVNGQQYAVDRRLFDGVGTSLNAGRASSNIATLRYASGERGNVKISKWTSTGIVWTVTYDSINSYAGVLLLNYGEARSRVGLLSVPLAAGYATVSTDWQPQFVQHLLHIMGTPEITSTADRAGMIGVHVVDESGEYSALSVSENDVGTSSEMSLSDDRVYVTDHSGTANTVGTTTLNGTGYALALDTVDGISISWPFVAVEKVEIGEEAAELTAAFQAKYDTSGFAPLMVHLADLSTGNFPIVAWEWDFGDGIGKSTAQNPMYLYEDPGTYDVTLTVTDSQGNVDTHTETAFFTVDVPTRDNEIVVGPLLATTDVGQATGTITHYESNPYLLAATDGTMQFAAAFEEIYFINGWRIVVDEGVLRIKKPDDSLWDFDLTEVVY